MLTEQGITKKNNSKRC